MLKQSHPGSLQPLLGLLLAALWLVPVSAQEVGSLERELPAALTSCSFPERSDVAYTRRSLYVPMADGVRLAVDIYLPRHRAYDAKLPTLYTATRYWRAWRGDPLPPTQRSWVAQGYAVVNADVRGTGASFGQWYIPYSPQEARDVGYLANWIARQPWSNGKVRNDRQLLSWHHRTHGPSLWGPSDQSRCSDILGL